MSSLSLTVANGFYDLKTQTYPPILTANEEYELAVKLYEKNDLKAAKKLILSHLRFVAFIANGYKGYGLDKADLIQEGIVGLMKAIKKFNPYKKIRLSSFAVYWIRAEIHEFILKNWKIVKIATTKAQRKLFFKLKQATKQIHHFLTNKEADNIAKDLGVRQKDVLEMESRLYSQDITFETDSDDEDNFSPEQYLTDETQIPEKLILESDDEESKKKRLYEILNSLDARSLDILQSRYLKEKKSTLHSLADKYGVSAERIRQLENKAIKKLRDDLKISID